MPLGLPVVPEVYRMNSGCSESKASGVCWSDWSSTSSCHHRSRPSVHSTSVSVRLTTSTCSMLGVFATASSTAAFSGAGLPRRYWPSAVITSLACASSMRERSASAEKPPNTTLCVRPSRAHASIEKIASGSIGM